MPVNEKMMGNMQKEYGMEKGKRVYYATEMKRKKKKKAPKMDMEKKGGYLYG